MSFVIDKMSAEDWEQVRTVYLEGIATGHATFETQAPTWEQWDARHLPYSRLVAREGETIKGWAALSPVSSRHVYAGVAEISVYVGKNHRGEGVGKALLEALISDSENNGIWSLQAGIFPENSRSITMHKQCGFREVGKRERIGKMNGIWRDTVLLERRSKIVGAD
ncbi:MAG: N-acetyltransferase [Acidobacteria bacterium]|nr:N-acetyltransferase [Acidobacteriota bacterium]